MVWKAKLAATLSNSPDATECAATYAAERNIWGYYHKHTGEKHDAAGKAKLRERSEQIMAASVLASEAKLMGQQDQAASAR